MRKQGLKLQQQAGSSACVFFASHREQMNPVACEVACHAHLRIGLKRAPVRAEA